MSSLGKITTHNRNNPCPVCGNTDGGCKEAHDPAKGDKPVTLCRTYADARKFEIINGYICIGEQKNGHTATFAEHDPNYSSNRPKLSKSELEIKEAERRREQEQQEKREKEAALSRSGRNVYHKEILEELNLSPRHKEHLISKGLTEEEISKKGFRSITRKQILKGKYPKNLPGIIIENGVTKLNNITDGILCPVIDTWGYITGFQVKNIDNPNCSKYYWISYTELGKTVKTKEFNELPIAVAVPAELKTTDIYLAEGTTIKPDIAARELGAIVLGAAGGNFPQQTLKAYYEAIKEAFEVVRRDKVGDNFKLEYSIRKAIPDKEEFFKAYADFGKKDKNGFYKRFQELSKVIILPDAGWAENPGVTNTLKNNAAKCQDMLGLQPYVADWGQSEDKAVGDVDENADIAERINLLSWSKFSQKYGYVFDKPASRKGVENKNLNIADCRQMLVEKGWKKPQRDSIDFKVQTSIFLQGGTKAVDNAAFADKHNCLTISIIGSDWHNYTDKLLALLKDKAEGLLEKKFKPTDIKVYYLPQAGEVDYEEAFGNPSDKENNYALSLALQKFRVWLEGRAREISEKLTHEQKEKATAKAEKKRIAERNKKVINPAYQEFSEPITTWNEYLKLQSLEIEECYSVLWWGQVHRARGNRQKKLKGNPLDFCFRTDQFLRNTSTYFTRLTFEEYLRNHNRRYLMRVFLKDSKINRNAKKIVDHCKNRGFATKVYENSTTELGELVDYWREYRPGFYLVLSLMGSGKTKSLKDIKDLQRKRCSEIELKIAKSFQALEDKNLERTPENMWQELEGDRQAYFLWEAHRDNVIHYLAEWGLGLFLITSRRSLNSQTSERTGIPTREELKNVGKGLSRCQALCPESILHLPLEAATGASFLWDEIESTLKHIFQSTTMKKVRGGKARASRIQHIINLLNHALLTGGRVICMDANLDIRTIERLFKLLKISLTEEDTHKELIYNEFLAHKKWECEVILGTERKSGEGEVLTDIPKDILKNDETAILRRIAESIGKGKKLFVCTDNKSVARTLNKYLEDRFNKAGLIITGDDCGEEQKEFLKNPDLYLSEEKPAWVICSPSVESGISIESVYFDNVFGLFYGIVSPNVALQMLGRVRQPVKRIIWSVVQPNNRLGIKSEGNFDPTEDGWRFDPERILMNSSNKTRYYYDATKALGTLADLEDAARKEKLNFNYWIAVKKAGDYQEALPFDPITPNDVWAELRASDNKEKFLYQQELWWRLEEGDRSITFNDDDGLEYDDKFNKAWAEADEGVKRYKARKIAAAPLLSEEKLDQLRNLDRDLTEEERYQLLKGHLHQTLNGEFDITEDLAYEYYCKNDGRGLEELVTIAKSYELDSHLVERKKEQHYFLKQSEDFLFLGDVPSAPGKFLSDCKLPELMGQELTLPQVKQVISEVKLPQTLEASNLTSLEPLDYLNKLASKVGAKVTENNVVEGLTQPTYRIAHPLEAQENYTEIFGAIRRRVVNQGNKAKAKLLKLRLENRSGLDIQAREKLWQEWFKYNPEAIYK